MNGCPSKAKGDIAEAMIAARLLQKGFAVLKPFGDNLRYDLVIDDGIKLSKVQCKSARSARYVDGSIRFDTCSGRDKQVYSGQIDLFGVYCQELDEVFVVPIEDCAAARMKTLRVLPSKTGKQ